MDGILVINKEKEWTSHDVVAKVKKICNSKVGHIGTLDPMATGVLPLLLGKGTKLSQYLIQHDKIYEVTLQFGIRTDTGDIEGNILEKKDKIILENKKVVTALKSFMGEQTQIPPKYSAIKIKGKKLYEYARKGEEIEIPKRTINIYDIELESINNAEQNISFKVHCSKGTYIRSLCEDIAKKLGTIGYMKELNRVKVGKFDLENAITIRKLEENIQNEEFMEKNLITIEKFFEDKEIICIDNQKLNLFLNGVKLSVNEKDDFYRITNENKFIGIGVIKNGELKREIVL